MNLLHSPLPPLWAAIAWLVLVPLALHSLLRVRSGAALRSGQQHLWLSCVVLLSSLWTLQARAVEGATFGLLGGALYALIFGRHWARIGLLAAVALHTGLGGGSWVNFGVNGLLLSVVPTALASALQ